MSIEKFGRDEYILSCDICDEDCDEVFDEFYDAVYYKKDDSNEWTSRKIDGEWNDLCPSCAEKYKNGEPL